MKSDQSGSFSSQIFSGWKDIANYLGKGVRTVQRYEGELRLPVRRPAGKMRGSVVATKDELDAWVKASPIREMYHLKAPENQGNGVRLEEFKHGVEEMRRLRKQMTDLRLELLASVSVLHKSIGNITGYATRSPRSDDEVFKVTSTGPDENSVLGLQMVGGRKAS